VFSRQHRKVKLLFGLADTLLISIAFLAAYGTRFSLNAKGLFYWVFYIDFRVAVVLLAVSALCWLSIGHGLKIYEKLDTGRPGALIWDTARQCGLGAICLVMAEFLLRLDLSRFFVILFAFYAWVLLCLLRLNAAYLAGVFRRRFGTPRFVLVVGSDESARRVGRAIEKSSQHGIRLLGFLDDEPGQVRLAGTYERYALSRLPELLCERVVDEVIFAVDSQRLCGLEEVFRLCNEEGVRTRVVVDFFPHAKSLAYLDGLDGLPLLTFSSAPHDEIRLLAKRAIDVTLAAAALVILSPIMLVVALLIRVTSPGRAIFRQERFGLNGRKFTIYKFRSMYQNADQMKSSVAYLNQRSIAFKIPDDPRMTGLGRILRKFSVDEWPQLWNVLKGDMSLVGPRPAIAEEVERYERWQRRRLRMRPGLTCLWALGGRDALDFETWMKLDMEYIDNWSLGLDCKIMLRTFPQVLIGQGAH
jgi:exopolysaccharide biosynthesis polyprenyl glycosylphosphotransferase